MMKRTSSVARRAAAMALVMLGACWLCGCGASVESLCEDQCDCEGCSDAELEECISEGEEYEANLEEHDCSDEWDDYLDCLDESFECVDGDAKFDESCAAGMITCYGVDDD